MGGSYQGKPGSPNRYATHRQFTTTTGAALTKKTGSPATAWVWCVLWDMWRDGAIRGASISRLAIKTGLTRPTVRKALQALLERGLIEVTSKVGKVPIYGMYHVPWEASGLANC
jgi:DNA-binding transcriptional ArsR family regulator